MPESDPGGKAHPGKPEGRPGRTEHEQNILTAARGASITFLGKLVMQALSLGFIFVMARMLGAEQYGLYRLTITIVMILAGISMVGLDAGLKRFVAAGRKENSEARIGGVLRLGLSLPFMVSVGFAVIVAVAADPISNHLFEAPDLAPLLRIACITIPILATVNSLSSIATGYKRVEYDVYTQDIGFESARFTFSVIAILLGFGVVGVTIGYVIAAFLGFLPLVYLVNRLIPLRKALGPVENQNREVLRFSIPIFFSTLLNQFGRRLETLVLGVFSIVADVGVYSAMLSITNVGTLANVALRGIATPIISELHSERKFDDLKKFYQTITKWGVIFNLPIFLVMVLFNENLLSLLGKEFTVGAFGLIILAFGNMFDASTGVCGVMISYSGHSKVTLFNSVAYLVISIALDLLLIPRWGLEGAAWAGSLTIIILNSIRLVEVYVLIEKSTPFNWTFLKPLSACVIAGGVTAYLRPFVFADSALLQIITLSVFMVVVYGGLISLMGVSDEEKLVLRRLRKGIGKKGGKRRKSDG